MEHMQKLEFPAVSVCNLNRLKFLDGQDSYNPYSPSPVGGPEIEGTPLQFSERRNYFQCGNGQNLTWNEDIKTERRLLIEYYEMDEMKRFKSGHLPFVFMNTCFFNGKLCPPNRITYFQNIRYGNCITFNGRNKDMKPLKVFDTGSGNGLILELDLESSFYQQFSKTIGARVVIHDPNETPTPEEQGFDVGPGYETSISLRQSVVFRLPAPFRDRCVDYRIREESSVSNQKDCVRTCIQTENFAKCGCIDQTLDVMNGLQPCNLINDSEMCCLDDILKNMTKHGPTCDCPQPCISVSYNEVLSTAIWPSKALISSGLYMFRGHKDEALRLNIFYSSLEKAVYEQKPKFEGFELISYLGCELGLWLGLSLLSVFEIVEKMSLIVKRNSL
ncbi:amiloride-sensitive sodium channel subunit gamma [Nephila pilipes]|uniref:Amiloride-sensitive sodium channel subunit gamma n=1 Tax=Nephila pilipes TaxID=299642 RepID=A0A8X6QVS9_NEPPI|nr:amiloride-sensitive sodium channel subunit gamma [Nephila pilipes]